MRTLQLLFFLSVCISCGPQTPLTFPSNDETCGERFHDALPEEAAFSTQPRLYAASGSRDSEEGKYGRLTVEDPYMADGLVRLRLDDDGADVVMDFEGTAGYAGGFQIDDFTYDDDRAVHFSTLSHWCGDGSYIGQVTSDLGSATTFGQMRKADDEDWHRKKPSADDPYRENETQLQVLDVTLYDCAYESGEQEAWHEEHCQLLARGTFHRRK